MSSGYGCRFVGLARRRGADGDVRHSTSLCGGCSRLLDTAENSVEKERDTPDLTSRPPSAPLPPFSSLAPLFVLSASFPSQFSRRNSGQVALAVASPAFITSLILYVSGIPMLEEQHEKKYGNDPK